MQQNNRYVTIKDVAREAGTSIATVSYVLNDSPNRYVSEELRNRVFQVAKEMGYVKCALASGLRGKRRGLISVTVPQYSNIYFCRIVLAIEQIAVEHGYVLSICNIFEDAEREKKVLDMIISQRVDGFLLIPTSDSRENYQAVRRLKMPYVVVERSIENETDYNYVCADNYRAGWLAAQMLYHMGHRQIGYIYWDSSVGNLKERRTGFQDYLAEHDCAAATLIQGEFTFAEGRRVTKELLEAHPELTGFVYEVHVMAQGGVTYMHEAGIRIPEDISVVVIGSPEWVYSNNPPIASIVMHEEEIGTVAANMLFDQILGTGSWKPKKKVIPCTVHEAKSIKCLL